MNDYVLKPDESVLYRGSVNLYDRKGNTELILTNLNLIFVTRCKKIFKAEEGYTHYYPIVEIKSYDGVPQVVSQKNNVRIYFMYDELMFSFDTKAELFRFKNAIVKLLSGKSFAQRSADKVKGAIKLVDDTLGIDSVGVTGQVMQNGVLGSVTKGLEKIGKSIFGKRKG